MATSVPLQQSETPGYSRPAELQSWEPLDEAVWKAWLAEGRARERRGTAARARAAAWVPIAVLLVASAGLWSSGGLYDTVARFIVTAGAIVVMFRAFRERHYALGAVLGAIALAYNPAAPAFGFSGHWQRAVLVASTGPFVMSLIWKEREAER